MKMCEHSQQLDLPLTESKSMRFVEDSPAKTSASPVKAQDWQGNGQDYGASTPVLLARLDRHTRLWKTSQRCLLEEWEKFSQTFPRSGMTQNGIAYQLQPLVRLTDATEYGSLPTPCARDWKDTGGASTFLRKSPSLGAIVMMFPTPTVSGNYNRVGCSAHSGDGLATVVKKLEGGGVLNQTWVEWLMGFPAGWTDLKD